MVKDSIYGKEDFYDTSFILADVQFSLFVSEGFLFAKLSSSSFRFGRNGVLQENEAGGSLGERKADQAQSAAGGSYRKKILRFGRGSG